MDGLLNLSARRSSAGDDARRDTVALRFHVTFPGKERECRRAGNVSLHDLLMRTSKLTTRALALLCLALLAGLLDVAPAAAEKCTLGVDTSRLYDRAPSACAPSGVGGPAVAPARGRDGAVWTVAGGQIVRQLGGATQRFPLTGRIAAAGRAGVQVGASPVGASIAAGSVAQTVGPDGQGQTVFLPGNALGSGAWFGTSLVVPTSAGLAMAGADGKATVVQTPGATPSGDAVTAHDGTVWFVSGAGVGRLGQDGVIQRHATGHRITTLAPANASEGGVWAAAADAALVFHVNDGGDVDKEFDVPGDPTGVTQGAGRNTVWATTSNNAYVTRISTRYFAGGYQHGFPCDRKVPAACQNEINSTPAGSGSVYNPPAAPTGIALGTDGRVYTAAADGLFAIRVSRPMLPCERRGIEIGGPHGAYACQDGTWSSFVTQKATYPRISCPRLNFRYCAGIATIFYKGKRFGRVGFVVRTYDNPDLRIPVTKAKFRMINAQPKHEIHASIELRSRDGGGILRVGRYPIILFAGTHDRANTAPRPLG
jgi:hypothetical protein